MSVMEEHPLNPLKRFWLEAVCVGGHSQSLPRPPGRTDTRHSALLLTGVAAALALMRVPLALSDPTFIGDSGWRLDHASEIGRLGLRTWLPFLQAHIWVLYQLRLPAVLFKLIPCLYYFLALVFLGRITWRLSGGGRSGLALSVFLMFCFGHQRIVLFLSTNLYQEIVVVALFYALLYFGALDLHRSGLVVFLMALALLTREIFVIYLAVVTVLNLSRILRDRRVLAAFLALWAVPTLWYGSVPLRYLAVSGRLPSFPLEWPLMINKGASGLAFASPLSSASSLGIAMIRNGGIPFLLVAVAAAWGSVVLCRRSPASSSGGSPVLHWRRFRVFSLISLALVYALVVLFDPWEATFGNPRMSLPLTEHLFVWIVLLYTAAAGCSGLVARFARGAVVAALLLSVVFQLLVRPVRWFPDGTHREVRQAHVDIREVVASSGPDVQPEICIVGDYFDSVTLFIAPILYDRRRWVDLDTEMPATCNVIIAPADHDGLRACGAPRSVFELDGRHYTVCATTALATRSSAVSDRFPTATGETLSTRE